MANFGEVQEFHDPMGYEYQGFIHNPYFRNINDEEDWFETHFNDEL